MNILLANYRYFVSGGPERYMFNITNMMEARGHKIIPFSIKYARNETTPYASYFVESIGGKDRITFREQGLAPKTVIRSFSRLFYGRDVERAIRKLTADTGAQVAYVMHYLRKLSPSLLVGLKKSGLPIVVRLSDFNMMCPQSHFLRNDIPCTLCLNGNLWWSVRYRCVQRSVVISFINALATYYHRFRQYFDLVDVFVTTNPFMYRFLVSAGFPETRLRNISTLVDSMLFCPPADLVKEGYFVYAGRLTRTKGVHIILEATSILLRTRPDLKFSIKIIGNGDRAYKTLLKQMVQEKGLQNNVEFINEINSKELSGILARAQLSVVPSLWYENLPNSILESYACGTPVLASDIGSLSGCVWNGETGYLFRPNDAQSLAERIAFCMDNPTQVAGMSRRARQVAETIYAPERHIAALEDLFEELTNSEIPSRNRRE